MHELSIIQSIIDTSTAELVKTGVHQQIEAIDLEIGDLAGIEIASIEFLWSAAVEHTVLEHAVCNIHRIAGEAECGECNRHFAVRNFYDPCPDCNSHFIRIIKGEELKIKSLTLSDELLVQTTAN